MSFRIAATLLALALVQSGCSKKGADLANDNANGKVSLSSIVTPGQESAPNSADATAAADKDAGVGQKGHQAQRNIASQNAQGVSPGAAAAVMGASVAGAGAAAGAAVESKGFFARLFGGSKTSAPGATD